MNIEALKNKLITITLALIELPCLLAELRIVPIVTNIFGYNDFGDSDYEFEPFFHIAAVGFIFHLILYAFFRFAVKKKIHIQILTALLILFVIFIPFMVQEFLHTYFVLGTMAITLGCMFLYQAILFGAFIVTLSLLDRRIVSMSWLKILISFVTAIAVGTLVSWSIWTLLMKLYLSMHFPLGYVY